MGKIAMARIAIVRKDGALTGMTVRQDTLEGLTARGTVFHRLPDGMTVGDPHVPWDEQLATFLAVGRESAMSEDNDLDEQFWRRDA